MVHTYTLDFTQALRKYTLNNILEALIPQVYNAKQNSDSVLIADIRRDIFKQVASNPKAEGVLDYRLSKTLARTENPENFKVTFKKSSNSIDLTVLD